MEIASNELQQLVHALDSRRRRLLRWTEASGDDPSDIQAELTELSEHLLVAEEELRVQREQLDQNQAVATSIATSYATMVQWSADAVVLTNENGAVLSASQKAQTLVAPTQGAGPRPIPTWFALADRSTVRSGISILTRSDEPSLDLGILSLRGTDGPEAAAAVSVTRVLRLSERQCRLVWSFTPIAASESVPDPTSDFTCSDSLDVETELGRLSDIGARLSRSRSVDEVLQTVADGARICFPAVRFADIYLPDRQAAGRGRRLADTPAQHLNALQRGLHEGPALDALTGRATISTDLPTDPRWPRLATVVPTYLRAAMALPLYRAGRPAAALMLLSDRPHAFDTVDRQAVHLFGVQAGLCLDRAVTEESLDGAIRRREIVGPAIGILAERYRIDTGAAVEALREASQRINVKVIELASEIVRTGRVPEAVEQSARSRRQPSRHGPGEV